MRYLLAVLIAVPLGLIPAFIAKSKGRNFALWWLYGWALFIVALPHSILIEPRPPLTADQTEKGKTKVCPRCAETIKAEALKCHFCGHDFRPLRKRAWFIPTVIVGDLLVVGLYLVLTLVLFGPKPYRDANQIIGKLRTAGVPCSPFKKQPPRPGEGLQSEVKCNDNGEGIDSPNLLVVDVFQTPTDVQRDLKSFLDSASCSDWKQAGFPDAAIVIAQGNWEITFFPLNLQTTIYGHPSRLLVDHALRAVGGREFRCSL